MSVETTLDRLPAAEARTPPTGNPPGAQFVLHGVSWSFYEHLLAEREERRSPRVTFDRGTLHLMTTSLQHERYKALIDHLIAFAALERNVDYLDAGSTTFKREDLERGFEPDVCFYVQHAAQVAGKDALDLQQDPPPDLVVELEITRSVLDRLPIFVAVGVPEVWRYDGQRLQVLRLEGGEYVEHAQSLAFPLLTGERLTEFLAASQTMARTTWLRSVRDWARTQAASSDEPRGADS